MKGRGSFSTSLMTSPSSVITVFSLTYFGIFVNIDPVHLHESRNGTFFELNIKSSIYYSHSLAIISG